MKRLVTIIRLRLLVMRTVRTARRKIIIAGPRKWNGVINASKPSAKAIAPAAIFSHIVSSKEFMFSVIKYSDQPVRRFFALTNVVSISGILIIKRLPVNRLTG